MSRATFVVLCGDEVGKQITLDDGMVIGRSRNASVRFDRDTLSRRHALLERRDDTYLIRDLGSMHGVWVNNLRVTQQRLVDGDLVRLGELILKYLSEAPTQCRPFVPSYVDGLTGLPNKRAFYAGLSDVLRANRGATLLRFDVDEMVHFNHRHGHIAGDRALVQISKLLADATPAGSLYRTGGQVFSALVTLDTDARAVADAARLAVAQKPVVVEGVPVTLTVSAGIAMMRAGAYATSSDIEEIADDRVYAAKRAGRNRIA